MTAEHNRTWVNGARVGVIGSVVLALVIQFVFPQYKQMGWAACLAAIASYLTGRYATPGLDTISLGSNDTAMVRELGFLGFIMAQYWVLYAVVIHILSALIGVDENRPVTEGSILSRSIILGTLLRMVFIDVPLILFARLAIFIFNLAIPQGAWAAPLLAGQFLGLGLSDAIHLLLLKRGEHVRQQFNPKSTRANTRRSRPERPGRGPRERGE